MTTHTCKISIAGITLALDCEHEQLAQQLAQRYAAFASHAPAVLHVPIEWQTSALDDGLASDYHFSFAQGKLKFASLHYEGEIDLADRQAWLRLQTPSPWVGVEYFIRVVYALLVFDHGGLLLHGAGLVRGGRAFLFFGHSGSGKTTVARLSRNVIVMNDDLIALRPLGESWQAYATPFWNPTQVAPTPHAAPLAGLYRLVQDQQVWLESISVAQAVAELTSSLPVISADPTRSELMVLRCMQLAQQVGLKRLHFRKDDSFWDVVDSPVDHGG